MSLPRVLTAFSYTYTQGQRRRGGACPAGPARPEHGGQSRRAAVHRTFASHRRAIAPEGQLQSNWRPLGFWSSRFAAVLILLCRVRLLVGLQHAVSIFEQVLALIPNQKMCLLQLGASSLFVPYVVVCCFVVHQGHRVWLTRCWRAGKIWLSVKNYDKALPYLMRGVEVYSLDPEFHSTYVRPTTPRPCVTLALAFDVMYDLNAGSATASTPLKPTPRRSNAT